jgi:UDP-GlcNAc:undecaprenyl-phosphate GlcNAc-1-phosphate transferase
MDYNLGLLLLVLLVGLVVTGESMPLFVGLSHKLDILAYPGGRKLHKKPTPLLGGVAIYLPFAICLLFLVSLVLSDRLQLKQPSLSQMISLLIGATWILCLGVLDDKFGLGWKRKLGGQLLGVVILVAGGHSIEIATVPFLGPVKFGWLGPIVFGVAVLVITNAINLIDGLDGLAGGICFFAAITSGMIGYCKGDWFTAVVAFSISGALLGFLRHNFPPASIYMGDGGSLLLGFVLGTLATSGAALQPGQRSGTLGVLLVPFLPFGIALLDVALSIGRRLLSGKKIFWADSDHLHHRLMEKFRYPRRVVVILYAFSALLSAVTLCLALGQPQHPLISGFIYLSSLVVLVVVVMMLRLYRNESIVQTLENRPHFKYLCFFHSFMGRRIRRAKSFLELVSLLERGVKDLNFDLVEVYQHGRLLDCWTNPWRSHPDKRPIVDEKYMEQFDLHIKWVIPSHDSSSYQKSLEVTWFRFLNHIERRMGQLHKSRAHAAARLAEQAAEPSANVSRH